MNEGIKKVWWVLNDLMVPGSKVWGFALRAWSFALRASTPQDDPTGRVQGLKNKGLKAGFISLICSISSIGWISEMAAIKRFEDL